MGGGTPHVLDKGRLVIGLSPSGRGNPSQRPACHAPVRSIPAWAGEPNPLNGNIHSRKVYPRVGGGTITAPSVAPPGFGLSPRGRGNRCGELSKPVQEGSIPAWAGEPLAGGGHHVRARVYPRVGGGTRHSKAHECRQPGLSPRGRGNPRCGCGAEIKWRSIPAWAGEPGRLLERDSCQGVYPPRGRGNLTTKPIPTITPRSIPAWAGEPASALRVALVTGVYPRVGGGTLLRPRLIHREEGLSPRGRGNHSISIERGEESGSIPAWAGKPSRQARR